jgi:hypothetical protein
MGSGRVGVTATAVFPTAIGARSNSACSDVADVGRPAGQFAIGLCMGLKSSGRLRGRQVLCGVAPRSPQYSRSYRTVCRFELGEGWVSKPPVVARQDHERSVKRT